MNTVEELRRAWIEYYACGPDEHEARFEANARAKLLADLERYANPCPSPDEWLVQAYSDNK